MDLRSFFTSPFSFAGPTKNNAHSPAGVLNLFGLTPFPSRHRFFLHALFQVLWDTDPVPHPFSFFHCSSQVFLELLEFNFPSWLLLKRRAALNSCSDGDNFFFLDPSACVEQGDHRLLFVLSNLSGLFPP